jgi:hypothetical protein
MRKDAKGGVFGRAALVGLVSRSRRTHIQQYEDIQKYEDTHVFARGSMRMVASSGALPWCYVSSVL